MAAFDPLICGAPESDVLLIFDDLDSGLLSQIFKRTIGGSIVNHDHRGRVCITDRRQ